MHARDGEMKKGNVNVGMRTALGQHMERGSASSRAPFESHLLRVRLLLLIVVDTFGNEVRHLSLEAELGRAARARVVLRAGVVVLDARAECCDCSR